MAEEGGTEADVLHTGDLVLLKCQMSDKEMFVEASDGSNDTGYICCDGLKSELKIMGVESFHDLGNWDIREFLFQVVGQLTYIAQKDLNRFKKQLKNQSTEPTRAQANRIETLENRARTEELENVEKSRKQLGVPLHYGEMIQLRHVRTGRFVRVCPKLGAVLQRTSRRVDLHEGTSNSFMRINPLFRHKMQGQRVLLNEQVLLESARLGNNWNLNWTRCKNMSKDEVLEVNCSIMGRGFYLVLYQRDKWLDQGVFRLGYSLPLVLQHFHFAGNVTASSSRYKPVPFLRSLKEDNDAAAAKQRFTNSKDLWMVEPASTEDRGGAITWGGTRVYLRHFASGRYLAVAAPEVVQVKYHLDGQVEIIMPEDVEGRSPTPPGRKRQASMFKRTATAAPTTPGGMMFDTGPRIVSETRYGVELVGQPGPSATFTMHPTDVVTGQDSVPRNACIMLKWDDPVTTTELWLSCEGKQKGKRKSKMLLWSETKMQRDAIGLSVIDDESWLNEADVVSEHVKRLRYGITRRCKQFATDQNLAAMVCAQTEHALTDMIFFVSGSKLWRTTEVQTVQPDALGVPWEVVASRQRLVREMKYIDASMELFVEFVKQTQSGVYREQHHDIRWGRRAATLDVRMHVQPQGKDRHEEAQQWGQVMTSMIVSMKTRCLKLLVRLWLFCLLGSRDTEFYFYKNKWVEIINGLNGHGLGASDVFVAIMSNNPDLARRVDKETLLKFVDFIKVLGPNSTYVNFMKSVCAPREMAIGVKQQLVLSTVVYPGERAPAQEREEALNNRRDLFLSLKLAPADSAMELGKALIGSAPSPLEECLAREVLTYGLSDVVISWAHCKRWSPGMTGYLYHSPEAMGVRVKEKGQFGKAWVSLVDVAWVLQPFRCAELVTGRKWTEEDDASIPKHDSDAGIGEDTSPMALRLQLAEYFLAQLHLVADMVKDRQINCMMALQEEYSFSLCLCGASDPRLPTVVRAAFFNLITELWLDRCPHTQVVAPALMQQIDQVNERAEDLPIFQLTAVREPDAWSEEHKHSLSLEVQAFYRLGTPHKMEALMRCVRSYLCSGHKVEQLVHSEKDDMVMMLSLLRVLAKLFRFGFVHSAGLLQELVGPIMRSLDGRTDLIKPLKEVVLTRGRADTYGDEEGVSALEPTTPLLRDNRLEIDPSLDLGSNDGGRLPRSRFPVMDGTLRYSYFQGLKGDNTISEIKVEMLKIMLHTLQLGVHTKISRTLQIFRQLIGESTRDDRMARAAALLTPRSAIMALMPQAGLIDKVLRCLDDDSMVTLSCPGIRVPNVMCIDLMMYEDPKIFALALELLFTNCCQASFVFENLDKVELLTSPQIELFHKIKGDVAVLGDIIYSFENWGLEDNFSSIDMARFVQLQRICLNIRSLCIMGDASTTPLEVQKMLHETEFFSHFDYVFKQNRLDFVASSRPLFARMQALICSVASRFIASNPSNQTTIFNILPRTTWLLEDRSTGPDCSMLMVEVFRDNEELCQQVSPELCGQFGDLIKRDRSEGKFVPWYILFYLAIMQISNKPVVRNQEMVMDAIKFRNPQLCLHLLQGPAGVERILELCEGFNAMGQLRDPEVSRRVSDADGELIYYARSIELLARMSRGRGTKTLVIKPFVMSVFPIESMIRLIVRTGAPALTQSRDGSEMPPPSVTILVYLKARWMQLVNILLYDVEKSLLDMDLLGSPLHVEYFSMMRDWMEQVLAPAMTKTKFAMDRQSSKTSVEDGTPLMLGVEDEAYAQAMLHCIDSFFQGPFFAVKSFEVCAGLVEVALKYGELFGRFLRNIGDDQPRVGMRDVDYLIVTAHRVVAATEVFADDKAATLGRGGSKKRGPATAAASTGASLHMKTMSQAMKGKGGKKKSGASSDMEAQWRAMLDFLYQDQLINERLLQEEAQVSHVIHHISEFTDPSDRKYRDDLPQDAFSSLPDGVDYRRNIISTEDVLGRCVRYLRSHMRTDLASVRRVQRMLLGLFHKVRNDGDMTSLSILQRTCVKADVTKLIVQMLDSRVAEDVTRNAWSLLAEVLCTGNRDGDIFYANKGENILLVDKGVQSSVLTSMVNGDDSGMWESARDEFVNLAMRIKPMRTMRSLCMLTEEDILQQEEYQNELSYTVRILDALTLMVEGHYLPMQQYLYSQEGNSRSLNVPEMCANLLVRFCKDPRSSQLMDPKEIECTKQLMKVLTELMQGPNVRNQDFLCTQGVVETIMKLLPASFDVLKEQYGDYYPAPVRSLKAKFVETLLAFLDGRHDNKIHLNVLQRTDTQVLCDRVELVFRYFVFGIRFAAESTETAILPVTPENVRLLDVREDPVELHEEITRACEFAEELLEDLEDEELDSLFDEALSMLEFIYTLIPHSADFKKAVMPVEDDGGFVDDLALFPGSESEWKRERRAHYQRTNYRMAFVFMARFVKTIEVVLDGHLQTLHFRQPLTAMWYVHGEAKSRLLDTIPLSPADIKAKAFVEQCKQMHKQSVLIRYLSRWSYIPEKQLHFARRHLPDWAHRPFHIFFCQDARGIQLLLELSLYIGGALAMHAGIFLVAKRSNDLHIQGTAWSSVTTEVMSYILGSVYLICNGLWVLLSAFIKVPLIIEKRRQELGLKVDDELETRHKLGALRNILNDAEFIWRAVLVLFTVAALFFEEYWLYTFIMLDIFCQNKLLATVLKAITAPITSLCMTCVGAYLVGFIYAALGFHHFRKEFGDYCDENIMTCTKNIMYQTTRTGIVGLSGMMELRMPDNKDFGDRMAYDMTYFIIFGIMLLNTIVGLIVDSFSALRNEQEARIHNLKTESFISCIERRRIEAAAVHEGFEHHEMVRQNKWDYMAFIFYLREKRLQDYTGVEQKIRNMVDNKDAKWLPINRSKVLEESREVQEEYEDVLKRLEKNTDNLLKVTSHQEMQTALRAIMAVNLHFRHGIEELMGAIEATAADVEGIKNTLAARQERAGSHRRPPPPPGEGGDDAPARTESQFSVRGAFTRSQTGGSYSGRSWQGLHAAKPQQATEMCGRPQSTVGCSRPAGGEGPAAGPPGEPADPKCDPVGAASPVSTSTVSPLRRTMGMSFGGLRSGLSAPANFQPRRRSPRWRTRARRSQKSTATWSSSSSPR